MRYEGQAPDIDGHVLINDSNGKVLSVGTFVDVKITEVLEYDLIEKSWNKVTKQNTAKTIKYMGFFLF